MLSGNHTDLKLHSNTQTNGLVQILNIWKCRYKPLALPTLSSGLKWETYLNFANILQVKQMERFWLQLILPLFKSCQEHIYE